MIQWIRILIFKDITRLMIENLRKLKNKENCKYEKFIIFE